MCLSDTLGNGEHSVSDDSRRQLTTFLKRVLRKAIFHVLSHDSSKERGKQLLMLVASAYELDLLRICYNQIGVLNYETALQSGEHYLVNRVLGELLPAEQGRERVFFDVGANVGDYSIMLARAFPEAIIYAFEPNPHAFDELQENIEGFKNIVPVNIGLGDEVDKKNICIREDQPATSHASLHRSVLSEFHGYTRLRSEEVTISTIDEVCCDHDVDTITFLKIDTEGYELQVLEGAQQALAKGAITVLQFEFNEMNVIARVFLKDFFDLLSEFDMFRLLPNGLRCLPRYSSRHEIFLYQNILAIHKSVERDRFECFLK